MQKVNLAEIEENSWSSPKGKFASASKGISQALGADCSSTDLNVRHPFDLEWLRIAPGRTPYVYHSHSAQWELYHVISGAGTVRHKGGRTAIEAGDAFVFKPGEAHQLINDSADDLVLLVIADNPVGESCYYPDSNKWLVRSPERRLMRGESLDYFDGEE
jgi:uncharacterized cupin superfamily protein